MSAPAMKLSGLLLMNTAALMFEALATSVSHIASASADMPLLNVFIFSGPSRRMMAMPSAVTSTGRKYLGREEG